MAEKKHKNRGYHSPTRLAHAGRSRAVHGMVNPGVYHASTITTDSLDHWFSGRGEFRYGRYGTPTQKALEESVVQLEGGHSCFLFPSGLSAITSSLLACLAPGDHVLMTDSVYQPTRNFCSKFLTNFGVETTFYDPETGSGIAGLVRDNTKVIFLESPGSLTMEVQDVPAITRIARDRGITTIIDNTWSAGYFFNALAAGCDISIQAGTKYIVGHSDVMLGTATVNERVEKDFRSKYNLLGLHVGPDDSYLALRGLHTMDVRLERHMKNAVEVATWLSNRAEVAEVFYPALADSKGHDIWKRDFSGACGLFSIRFHDGSRESVAAMIDNLELFGIGASWGGFESLVIPFEPTAYRTAVPWPHEGTCLRFHIGLEAPADLIADLAAGLERKRAVTC